jgi:hypothetical protein
LQVASWFDRPSYVEVGASVWYVHDENILHQGPVRLSGGVRTRIFGIHPCVSKVPLVKFRKSIALSAGTHLIQGARVADLRGALLHFKFLDDFAVNIEREIDRKQHWDNAVEYQGYGAVLNLTPNLNFMSPISEKFASSSQLIRLGIMKTSSRFTGHETSIREQYPRGQEERMMMQDSQSE